MLHPPLPSLHLKTEKNRSGLEVSQVLPQQVIISRYTGNDSTDCTTPSGGATKYKDIPVTAAVV